MSEPEPPTNHLAEAVDRQESRDRVWRAHGERSLARNLAMIGVVGWLVVFPILAGIFAGHWLDGRFHTGITFTAGLVMFGAVVGGYLGWQRMNRE